MKTSFFNLILMGNSFGCSASGERLVSAARDGDLQEAKALLEYNPRLARYSTFGVRNSPLHYSAAQGHHEIVSLLIESSIDINLRNYRGQTALMQACQYGHWEVVQTLIIFKANIHRADYLNGGTALHLAALNGHTRCVRLLLADYVPSSISDLCTLLSENNDEGALYEVINKPADGGVSALHMAALNGHAETILLLLNLGASVHEATVDDGSTIDLVGAGSTPLHYAACGGSAQCCQLLIAKGASLTAQNTNGMTPLMVARSWNRDFLEDILSRQPRSQPKMSPSPFLCLPLMSIIEIARRRGWRGGWRSDNSSSTCLDPCVVCLERKCTVAAQGCSHEFCTHCALYLCSTNTSSTVADGPPGSIPCPLCRNGIVGFVELSGTISSPEIKEIARTSLSLPFCNCAAPHLNSSETMQSCKRDFRFSPPLIGSSSFRSLSCKRFPSMKLGSTGLCMGASDMISPACLVRRKTDHSLRSQLVECPSSSSRFRRSVSQNDCRRWLCSLTQSMPNR
ncbi:probable E3 ubiquitin-protein ligase XBOS32 isoform X2 [Andrographis paniculata]|uniref:probable E3 ubiquitin-protein ligase XBOS32 isoform X2 n=1 Tax=Andrographis paniculata TaxID=175694 RepID=UPI0021E95F29|nr:probable E3 ubiquitin-protein ligase XBOS32 isoform X2 [Andrographis paniculata]